MKVFISWSGDRSRLMAKALREWLPRVVQSIQPWMSKSDISAGDRWQQALGKELEESRFGILCITQESLTSPWLTFEAGSLAKTASDSRVIPLLLDLELADLTGPLAQFQAKKVDKSDVKEVIEAINRATDLPILETIFAEQFELMWPQLEAKLQAIPVETGDAAPKRQPEEILEDVVSSVRSLEAQIRRLSSRVSTPSVYQGAPIYTGGVPVTVGSPRGYGRVYDPQLGVLLSPSETTVVSGIRQGRSVNELAAELGIPIETVKEIAMYANRGMESQYRIDYSGGLKEEPVEAKEENEDG